MTKPICPKCHSDKNVVVLVVGFRCVFCNLRFFKGDIVDLKHETQTKLNCSISELQ